MYHISPVLYKGCTVRVLRLLRSIFRHYQNPLEVLVSQENGPLASRNVSALARIALYLIMGCIT